ncbi:hypothetical protein SDC9_00399 [bioreactor metagenome]|uniref:Uncharacterized protein n=1 Tax=bioreactor metagenome TaxID=1076179 RepID=A0A644SJR7_9ZZZZ
MSKPKVIIEITPEGWETKIQVEGKEYSEKFILTRSGSESTGKTLELEPELEPYEELLSELESFFMYDVAKTLKNNC